MKITVIFDLISNRRHAAHTRHGFLRILNLDEVLPSSGRHHAALSSSYKLSAKRNSGFTLLEMLMVLGLLAVLMLSATSVLIDESAGEKQLQAQEDGTKVRWHQIRTAIIGDALLTLSNPSLISGYVADMGRLPANIAELVTKGTQDDWGSTALSSVYSGATGEIWAGWRGPYLYTAGSQFYRDGWGNEDANPANDVLNYGWDVSLSGAAPNHTAIAVKSLGYVGIDGGVGFNADYPTLAGQFLVNSSDWQMPTSSLAFNVMLNKEPTASQAGLELRIYYFVDTDIEEEISTQFSHDVSPVGASIKSVTIDAPTEPNLPIGKYAAIVMCTNGTPADKTDDTVYDGDCAAPNDKLPYYFTLQPRTSVITIPWNI